MRVIRVMVELLTPTRGNRRADAEAADSVRSQRATVGGAVVLRIFATANGIFRGAPARPRPAALPIISIARIPDFYSSRWCLPISPPILLSAVVLISRRDRVRSAHGHPLARRGVDPRLRLRPGQPSADSLDRSPACSISAP